MTLTAVGGTLSTVGGTIAGLAGAAPFDPSTVPGLWQWHDAEAITGLVDGDPVATWDDAHSINDSTQGTAAKRPTYYDTTRTINGKPVVWFDGVDDSAGTGAVKVLKPTTIFAVVKITDFSTNRTIVGAGAAGGIQFRVKNGNLQLLRQQIGLIATSTAALTADTVHLVTASYDASGNWAFRIDGMDAGSGINDQPIDAQAVVVGALPGLNEFMLGDIAERLIYDVVVSTSDRDSIESYLTSKWAV